MTEQAQRALIVAEVLQWKSTPYHMKSRIKGVGCDCGSFLIGVFQNLGMIQASVEPPNYPQDWWQHTTEERYKYAMMRHSHAILEGVAYRVGVAKGDVHVAPQPGMVALSRAAGSKVYNHGGIVTQWPRVVHAVAPCVEECDTTSHHLWALKEVAVFDLVKP